MQFSRKEFLTALILLAKQFEQLVHTVEDKKQAQKFRLIRGTIQPLAAPALY